MFMQTSIGGNFNPHSREGSDIVKPSFVEREHSISIHTPAKGVTTIGEFPNDDSEISIHTPAKGVTIENLVTPLLTDISIHTPAKGVTQ